MNEMQEKYIEGIEIQITEAFTIKYFGKDAECWWVNDEIGTIFYVNEHWFSFEDMLFCICKNISSKKLFECYSKFEEQIDTDNQLESKPFIEFLK